MTNHVRILNNPNLETSLIDNVPFAIAHLISFERPDGTFVYLTDAPYDITDVVDSVSTVYRSNKIVKVGDIQEAIEARASSMNLTLKATGLNASADVAYKAGSRLLLFEDGLGTTVYSRGWDEEGFQAGDKVYVYEIEPDGDPTTYDNWVAGTYDAFDIVIYNDVNYISNAGNNSSTPGADANWSVLTQQFTVDSLTKSSSGGNNEYYNELNLSADIQYPSSANLRVEQSSQELIALVQSKTSTLYSAYINRDVTIRRAHIATEDTTLSNSSSFSAGQMLGNSFIVFKGLTSKASFKEDPSKGATITWSISSHWADFVKVQGRFTSDHNHRALKINGEPDLDSLVRPDYAADLGFSRAEGSLSILATYKTQEKRTKFVKRGGLAGLLGGYKTKEYYETVEREVDLSFDLSGKYLPVVYGVRKVDSIPVFVDTNANNPAEVFVAYAICEGEVAAIYDIYVEGEPSVCLDQIDYDLRNISKKGTDGVNAQVFCFGRADRGDVLKGGVSVASDAVYNPIVYDRFDYTTFQAEFDGPGQGGGFRDVDLYDANNALINQNTGGAGLSHERTFRLDDPIDSDFIFHTGKSDQRANQLLVKQAQAQTGGGFKIQQDYFEGDPLSYWTQGHRMLDTAYAVSKMTLSEGEASIPEYEFVVKGKFVECYNYDGSYLHDRAYEIEKVASPTGTNENPHRFNVGDTVTFQYATNNGDDPINDLTTLTAGQGAPTVILDKWLQYDPNGDEDWRFTFDRKLPVYVPGTSTKITNWVMSQGGDDWHMLAHDYKVYTNSSIDIPVPIATVGAINSYENNISEVGGNAMFAISYRDNGADPADVITNTKIFESIIDYGITNNTPIYVTTGEINTKSRRFHAQLETIDTASNEIRVSAVPNVLETFAGSEDGLILSNAIVLKKGQSAASNLNDAKRARKGDILEFAGIAQKIDQVIEVQYEDNGTKYAAVAILTMPVDHTIDFDGSNRTLDVLTLGDERVSINPAMQLLDYLKNEKYGAGLRDSEITLDSFIDSAVLCDTKSDVTCITNSQATINQIYALVQDPGEIPDSTVDYPTYPFIGTVKSSTQIGSTGKFETVFTNTSGKLGHKVNDWRQVPNGAVIWNNGEAQKVTSRGIYESVSSAATNFPLTLLEADYTYDEQSPTTISVDVSTTTISGTVEGNPVVRKTNPGTTVANVPGYSLHDSDNVKYWRYVGWDSPEQRNVTRHQLNTIIDTSQQVFANVNSMLKQFNGVLRYTAGEYQLDIKSGAPAVYDEYDAGTDEQNPSSYSPGSYVVYNDVVYVQGGTSSTTVDPPSSPWLEAIDYYYWQDGVTDISDDDIIGTISISDKEIKDSANSVTSNIIDPQNKFTARNISFFNSTYLTEDKGVRKQKTVGFPAITNYFAARTNIEQFLEESRYGLTLSFTLDPKAYLLLSGNIIRLTYAPFSWENKYFRVQSTTLRSDGLVNITATEHNDNAYLIAYNRRYQQPVEPVEPTVPLPAPNYLVSNGILCSIGQIEIVVRTDLSDSVYGTTSGVSDLITTIFAIKHTYDSQTGNRTAPTNFSDGDLIVVRSRSPNKESGTLTTYWTEIPLEDYDEDGKVFYSFWAQNSNSRGKTSVIYPDKTGAGVVGCAIRPATEDSFSFSFSPQQSILAADSSGVVDTDTIDETLLSITAFKNGQPMAPVAGSGSLAANKFWVQNTANSNVDARTASVPSTNAGDPFQFEKIAATSDIVDTELIELGSSTFKIHFEALNRTDSGTPRTFTQNFQKIVLGADVYQTSASNREHILICDSNGVVLVNDFQCEIELDYFNTPVNYDDTSPYTDGTFRVGTITGEGDTVPGKAVHPTRGDTVVITIGGGSGFLTSGLPNNQYQDSTTLQVPLILNDSGDTIQTVFITIKKVFNGVRNGSEFFVSAGDGDVGYVIVDPDDVDNWKLDVALNDSSVTGGTDTAQRFASAVIEHPQGDGFIRPNDRVVLEGEGATRIYVGTGTSNPSTVTAASFSSRVVETIEGSMVVDGTLSADKLAANSAFINNLFVASNLVVGAEKRTADDLYGVGWADGQEYRTDGPYVIYDPDGGGEHVYSIAVNHTSNLSGGIKPGNTTYYTEISTNASSYFGTLVGAVYSRDKTSFGDTSKGFYMDASGNFEVSATNQTSFLRYNATDDSVTLKGRLSVIPGGRTKVVTWELNPDDDTKIDITDANVVTTFSGLGTGSATVYSNTTFSNEATAMFVVDSTSGAKKVGIFDSGSGQSNLESNATFDNGANASYFWEVNSSGNATPKKAGAGGSDTTLGSTTVSTSAGNILQVSLDGSDLKFYHSGSADPTVPVHTETGVTGGPHHWKGVFTGNGTTINHTKDIDFLRAPASNKVIGPTGPAGSTGVAQATIFAYNRNNSSNPTTLTPSTRYYKFSDGVLYDDTSLQAASTVIDANSNWTLEVPAYSASNPKLWVTVAQASGNGTYDTIDPSDWATPQILSEDGVDGAPGRNNAAVFCYRRHSSSTSAPTSNPSSDTDYTFSTGAFSPTSLGNSWTTTVPAATASLPHLWAKTAVATSTGATDTVAAGDWSGAYVTGIKGDEGDTGATGRKGGLYYTFETTTTMSDPGSGDVRWNNITPSSVTQIAIDNLTEDSLNVASYVNSWSAGTLTIQSANDDTRQAVFTVTGVTILSGYTRLTVTHVSGTTSRPSSGQAIVLNFSPDGADGSPGANGSAYFSVTRSAGSDTTDPSNAEVSSVIGRNPVDGDICTVQYTGSHDSAPGADAWRYDSGWTLFTAYIDGSLLVTGTIVGSALEIHDTSAISPGGSGMYIDNDNIRIYDSGQIRVRLGNLV